MDVGRGAFIVIEGSDGSGKATQAGLVKERLEAAGYSVTIFDFPRYDQPSSYFVKRYLDGAYGGTDEVGPYTSSLFYALDRFEAAPDIRKALQEGNIVICNRFTGSNMAHQGTKITNAEQRRGFFIWLDNLEFEMLRIPRPDISFVLRVPADVSQKLIASREKHDIHEADPSHLERTVAVYDDMTQLFPKDFQRIDCVRGGQLMDIETINAILWEKITPLLPPPSKRKPAVKPENASAPEPALAQVEEVTPSPQPQAGQQLKLEYASGLLLQKIERIVGDVKATLPDIPSIYRPAGLVPDAQNEYDAKTSTLLGLYAKLVSGLAKHGIGAEDARRNAAQALPVSATYAIELDPGNPRLEELIINLVNDALPEAQTAGASLFAQAIKLDPARFKSANKLLKKAGPSAVRSIAEEYLSENYIGDQPPVQLSAVWPRNETDLVADMLYEHSNLPLQTIQDRLATWPLSRKLAVFEAYLNDPELGPVLEKAHYSWDLLSPYSAFLDLQHASSEALAIQPLTPRYGYDIPKLIEDADLAETLEKCFDISLDLYSAMQRAGHMVEAQYATLNGHNQRWKMTQNARQLYGMLQRPTTDTNAASLLAQLRDKAAEVHPILGESLTQFHPAS